MFTSHIWALDALIAPWSPIQLSHPSCSTSCVLTSSAFDASKSKWFTFLAVNCTWIRLSYKEPTTTLYFLLWFIQIKHFLSTSTSKSQQIQHQRISCNIRVASEVCGKSISNRLYKLRCHWALVLHSISYLHTVFIAHCNSSKVKCIFFFSWEILLIGIVSEIQSTVNDVVKSSQSKSCTCDYCRL